MVAGHVDVRHPDDLLMAALLRQPSPWGSGRRMSREELAQAVIDLYRALYGAPLRTTGDYVRRLERGVSRWPGSTFREAFRSVLRVASDVELGFRICRRRVGR